MSHPKNKGHRNAIEQRKWIERLRLRNLPVEQKETYNSLKAQAKPCNCWACKRERYKRSEKHKLADYGI